MAKIDFSQLLRDLHSEPIRRAGMLHSETLGAVAAALNSLPGEIRAEAIKAINEHVAQPLTLSEAVTSALVAIYEDESRPGTLNGSERTTGLVLPMSRHVS